MSAEQPRIVMLVDPRSGFGANRAAGLMGAAVGAPIYPLEPRLLTTLRRLRSLRGDIEIIHAFGLRALTAAALSTRGPLVFTPDDEPTDRQLRWLRTIMNHREVHVVCSSVGQHRALFARNIPPDRCHLSHPGVDTDRLRVERDLDLRRALGFADDDRVMLLVGDNTRASGHADAIWAAAILHVLDTRFKVLAWRHGPRTASLLHFAASQKHSTLIRVAELKLGRPVEFEALFAASDLALVTPTAPVAALPIAIAMASGLPIIGTASAYVSEFLKDGENASLASPRSPRLLAQRILEVNGNPPRSVGPQLDFGIARFVEAHREIYRELLTGRRQPGPAGHR